MKVQITGASAFVNRMFEACGSYQWAREFLKNSLEANATKVEFGLEWLAVEKFGVYRRMVVDNGSGMDSEELRKFFATLGDGAKKIGSIHDNFGVGAKIASLPWNPEGIVVISHKNSKASMIWIVLDPESGDYELREFKFDGGNTTCVVDPSQIAWAEAGEVDWSMVSPPWVREHGTVIVLLGSEEYRDTILGNPQAGEKDIKGLSVYLNSRFWDLSAAEVRVLELRSEKKNSWPTSAADRDDARRPNNRQVHGAKYYLTDIKTQEGRLSASGTVLLDGDRVAAEWYLWEGERPAIHSYAKKLGYVAVRYNGELYQLTANKVHWRMFGIIEGKVQASTWIILEPPHYVAAAGRWGVHPDQSRNRLIFTGNGDKGGEVPLSDWGMEFAMGLPDEIREAITAARGEQGGSLDDEEYRKRLQDKFGNRWSTKVLVPKPPKATKSVPMTTEDGADEVEVSNPPDIDDGPDPTPRRERRRYKRTQLVVHKKGTPGGDGEGVERNAPVDMPTYRWAPADTFEKGWHLAMWAPTDPAGPSVVLNNDAPILMEVIRYHQEQYPPVFAEEVEKEVRQVYGEVAVTKIAHSQKLAREIPEEELNQTYRSEAALTISLMGLLAEESLISVRLGRLGKKKSVA